MLLSVRGGPHRSLESTRCGGKPSSAAALSKVLCASGPLFRGMLLIRAATARARARELFLCVPLLIEKILCDALYDEGSIF